MKNEIKLIEFKNETPFTVYTDNNSSLNDRNLWPGWVGAGGTDVEETGKLWVVNSYTSSILK